MSYTTSRWPVSKQERYESSSEPHQAPKPALRTALALAGLLPAMSRTAGRPDVRIGIVDGLVDLEHSAFATARVRAVRPDQNVGCRRLASSGCTHGTAVAGILFASRATAAPAICPDCSFLLYPIFDERSERRRSVTSAQLARAITETVDAGARIVNLSLGVITPEIAADRELEAACGYAAQKGALLVAASGNQGQIGFLPLLNHHWIIPVAACDLFGRLTQISNISPSIGARGLLAPGHEILTTFPGGSIERISGTSAAAAFVTGALALLAAEHPAATAAELRHAIVAGAGRRHRSMVPPLLNSEAAGKLYLHTNHKEST